ncbi:MAG: YggT family protein [Magnetovibrio sp.]|nr:YggT family protein [Magnetovibrio sp.]
MDVVLIPLMQVINTVVGLYVWIVVAGVVLSWLTAFGVLNTSNKAVYMIGDFIYRVTEPALRPIRNILPNMGAVDLSPVALILILMFIQSFLNQMVMKLV